MENVYDDDENTPINIAAQYVTDPEVMKLLIVKGRTSPNSRNAHRWTPLMHALKDHEVLNIL